MNLREYINTEAERIAREKRHFTLTDVAIIWGGKAEEVLAELLSRLAAGKIDEKSDHLMNTLRDAISELDNALGWVFDEQEAKKNA